MNVIDAKTLQNWRNTQKPHVLIDVREPYEYDEVNIKGQLIPLAEVMDRKSEIPDNIPVVIHCRSGKRSATAIKALEAMGYTNLINLEGGIIAYLELHDGTV